MGVREREGDLDKVLVKWKRMGRGCKGNGRRREGIREREGERVRVVNVCLRKRRLRREGVREKENYGFREKRMEIRKQRK